MVFDALEKSWGGELFVPKIPSYKIVDVATAIGSDCIQEEVGIRPGEKLHEQMISSEDSLSTFEYSDYYKILPMINEWAKDNLRIKEGKKVPEGFVYSSDKNSEWMTKSDLQKWIDINQNYIGKI